ncbi:two-component system sensor histidine kinase PilS (NtrC family) [Pseudoxanthomonas sp. 3HH-4]|uniref:sensor histidine kinase n=1 Tax=Pseudoxanthomonas sp. 3HH-4 TaxID=1690214 RepID=UPI00114EF5B9|nr:ATP-binding protein [Pseudoxanthomonas sp. 3HH-4]TQM06785.1 two-component system sensor histidine kinase PilS (NtrC family) [Pseudoxanthomonas sp. 3HH-4]
MRQAQSLLSRIESVPRRELYSFALYRVLEAGILAALMFSPLGDLLGQPRHGDLGMLVAIGYLVLALVLFFVGRSVQWLVWIVFISVCLDVLVAALITHALPGATAGVAMMLLFNVSAAALLLPSTRMALVVALIAIAALFGEYFFTFFHDQNSSRSLAEVIMFAVSYLALAYLAHQAGQKARASQALADKRGEEVANLFEVNELIIRRMRTGVLVVDADNHIKLSNEAASLLLGDGGDGKGVDGKGVSLQHAAPELARRLQRWRNGWQTDETPMQFSPDQPEVQPRFARLLADSDTSLIFLDDATVVSRRAESLTLAALGRFSASLAHEIRNPLAAINYAVQLLEESQQVSDGDRRLLQIIHQQCQRTNGIVESVLGLARRERATPEHIDLNTFARRFVDEYQQTLSIETDTLETIIGAKPVPALVDSRHLQQVVTVLVQNALNYGRLPGESARVRLRVFNAEGRPTIDVMDRGPGIPEAVAAQLFRPFFTTSEHGTGLGLYIARELCRANQATLEYVPVPGGGACFRIILPGPHALLPA